MRKVSLLLAVVVLCFSAWPVCAQEPQKPSPTDDIVRITTELVQTDVMVFDKDGRFVRGLKKEQFELLVDDKPQSIAFFEGVVMGGRNEATALRSSRGGKSAPTPSVETATSEDETERGRTILFFINDLHLDTGSISRVHKLINNFIDKQLGPND